MKNIMYKIPEIIVKAARELRKDMTQSEKKLWEKLRGNQLNYKVLRQKPIYVYTENNGLDRFIIADFYIHELKLIIEIDGSIHNLVEVLELDNHKEKLLNNFGYKIIRLKNEEITNNVNGVLIKLINFLP